MENFLLMLSGAGLLTLGWITRGFFSSYVKEKGKNLAAIEDAAQIAKLSEQVKIGFQNQLELTKSLLSREVEGLKHQLSLAADSTNRYEELKATAYVDFYKAASGLAIAQKWNNPEKELEATMALTDAKARIAVYGSAEVATALGVFFKEHGHLSSPEAARCFIQAIELMRVQTVGAADKVPINVLARLFLSGDIE